MGTVTTKPLVSTGVLRWHEGGTIRFLLNSEDTGGELALTEQKLWKGCEPPRHIHTREDETFLIQEGEITFCVGNQTLKASPGMVVFAPRGIDHHFKLETETAKFFLIVSPGGFERYYWNNTYDAPTNVMPPLPTAPPTLTTIHKRMLELVNFGVSFL